MIFRGAQTQVELVELMEKRQMEKTDGSTGQPGQGQRQTFPHTPPFPLKLQGTPQ